MSRPQRGNILITGASSGLGAGMAREFASRGRNLALAARRVDRLEELRSELLSEHPHITVTLRSLDVDRHEDVFTVFREFDEELGGIDRVVINAGLGKGQPLGTGYFRANAQTANTNFLGALAQSEAALELMRPRGEGHIVLISSMSALRGMPKNMTTYAASKAAVASLGEGMRADLAGTGIREHDLPRIHPFGDQREGEERTVHRRHGNRMPGAGGRDREGTGPGVRPVVAVGAPGLCDEGVTPVGDPPHGLKFPGP